MKMGEIRNRYGLNTALSVAHVVYTDNNGVIFPNGQRRGKIKFIRSRYCNDIEVEIPSMDEAIELVSLLNKEVKDSSCPTNLRNRFYSKKKDFLKYMLEHGMIDKVFESENHYRFVIGEFSFHQPKKYYHSGLKEVDGKEVYANDDVTVPFSINDYKKGMLGIIMTCANLR